MSTVTETLAPAPADAPRRRRLLTPGAVVATLLLVGIVGAVALAPVLAPGGYDAQDVASRYTAPTWFGAHPLGTDELGRDILVRVLYGGRPALGISVVAALLSTALGLTLALLAALGGGLWDGLLGRVADIQLAIPSILLALVVLAFAGTGFVPLVTVLSIGAWVLTFRILRVHAGTVAALPYIEAARLGGARTWSVLWRHVLPASAPLLIVALTLNFSSVLILESSLGYLGLGVQPPRPDWGQLVASGQAQLAGAWWISLIPGALIVLTVVSLQVIGDRLADHFSLATRKEH
ncbi:ABC transporter permease [Nocardioides sp.]|uniref:ABC transporter permease n=1 Tax=Nocardioides sp. TaxID=35761 RepID=UPI0039E2EA6A